jgi:hypothetical protein
VGARPPVGLGHDGVLLQAAADAGATDGSAEQLAEQLRETIDTYQREHQPLAWEQVRQVLSDLVWEVAELEQQADT